MSRAGRLGGAMAVVVLLAALPGSSSSGLVGEFARALGAGRATASGASAGGGPLTAASTFEPELGMPASNVVVIGASAGEASGETWAYGTVGDVPAVVNGRSYANQHVLLEHTDASSWQIVPLPAGENGEPVSPNTPTSVFPGKLGPLAGRTTAEGGVVLVSDGGIVSRDPGGQLQLVPPPSAEVAAPAAQGPKAEALLGEHESLPPHVPRPGASTPYTAIEDTSAHTAARHTGLLIAPYDDGGGTGETTRNPGILHYDGVEWTREAITAPSSLKTGFTPESEFTPEAVACGGQSAASPGDSPANCWLLATYRSEGSTGSTPNRLSLFRRVPHVPTLEDHSPYSWEEAPVLGDPLPLLGELAPPAGEPLNVTALGAGGEQAAQMLTVTSQGVWVDFQAKLGTGASADVSKLIVPQSTPTASRAVGTWCYPVGSVCPQGQARSLGASFPSQYQSFAWPGDGEDPGTRIVTGLRHGVLLELSGGAFSSAIGAGGEVTGAGGAAFVSPAQGWIGSGTGFETSDQQGQSQVIDVTPQPHGDQLQEAPVPFRYPLLAVAQAPATTPGDPAAPAIAVGLQGQVGRYTPGQGWRPESLYDAAGNARTSTLRGVAWPQPGRAYAVGDNGEMWLWRADTGLWEPDPAKPLNFIGDLTAIAFSSSDPNLGYAVGKNGTLLRFGKSWTQVPLPPELQVVNFTSVTFAGDEVLATYRTVVPTGAVVPPETGGVAVQEGSGPWHVDPSAAALLAQLPQSEDTVLSKVAGLADGGVVAAGPGLVIERDSSTGPWRFSSQPLPEAQNVSALAAYREISGAVRAVISIDLDSFLNPNGRPLQNGPWAGDVPAPSGAGQPPPFAPSDPLPSTGYLLKETASGWDDMEHMALEAPSGSQRPGEGAIADMPVRPDPVLALLVDPSGSSALGVGGQTYDLTGSNNGSGAGGAEAEFETAATVRLGPASAATADAVEPIATTPGHATFAVGGEAACARPCADFAPEGLAPDVSLSHALQSAGQIASSSPGGLRGFLYTGGRLQGGASTSLEPEAFEQELARYASLLGGGTMPVDAASSPGDLAAGGGIAPFAQSIVPGGVTPGPAGTAAYAFSSTAASGGEVRVVVLDCSTGEVGQAQRLWLSEQLREAASSLRAPAIVVGNAALGFALPDQIGNNPAPVEARDAAAVSAILAQAGASASAYLFDYPGANVRTQIAGATTVPVYGTGTLGYVSPPGPLVSDSLGSSGFLLLDVNAEVGAREASNKAPVEARIEPNISQLALDATDGVLLRRSHVALFQALARRPPSGVAVSLSSQGSVTLIGPQPYDPIPFTCQGNNCASAVPTDYTFTSSNPDIGDFVSHDPASTNPRQALLGANRLPVLDPKSGLFCAFNAGTTTVSITTGGLTYSEPVTVQAGSVEYPCGTVPLKNPPLAEAGAQASFTAPEPPVAGSPPPVSPHIQSVLPPPAPTTAPAPHPHPVVHHQQVLALPFVPLALPLVGARPAIVPPPAPPAARPIPPSGTSQVSQTVGAAEKEREEESATEIASSGKFAAYEVNRRGGPGPWILVLVVLAAGAGVGIGRGRRSSAREQPALSMAAARRGGR